MHSFLLALILVVLPLSQAMAHQDGAMIYDDDCCHNQDCGPVTQPPTFVTPDPGAVPVMTVTTIYGSAPLEKYTKIRQSKDARMHGCILFGRLICIYLPPGN